MRWEKWKYDEETCNGPIFHGTLSVTVVWLETAPVMVYGRSDMWQGPDGPFFLHTGVEYSREHHFMVCKCGNFIILAHLYIGNTLHKRCFLQPKPYIQIKSLRALTSSDEEKTSKSLSMPRQSLQLNGWAAVALFTLCGAGHNLHHTTKDTWLVLPMLKMHSQYC